MSGLLPARNGGDIWCANHSGAASISWGRLVACGIQFPILQWNDAE